MQDNLEREIFREKTELEVQIHSDMYQVIKNFHDDKTVYLDAKEQISTVNEAYLQLSQLEASLQEIQDIDSGNVTRLVGVGQAIRAAEYKSEYSSWVYPKPDEVEKLEASSNQHIESLKEKAAAKKLRLEDDLAREQFKEKVLLMVDQHNSQHDYLSSWASTKQEYLETKEENDNSQAAKYQLSRLELYAKEQEDMTAGAVASLKKLGDDIRAAEYKTEYSQWKYEKPEDVTALETDVDNKWASLNQAYQTKLELLQDDLERLLYAEQTRVLASQHADKFELCKSHAETKETQLNEEIHVNSISDAQLLISQLQSLDAERQSLLESVVSALKSMGQVILSRAYKSKLSEYSYEKPDEIKAFETEIDAAFNKLEQLSSQRSETLHQLLAKETRKEELRLEFANQASDYLRYCNDKIGDIGTPEQQKNILWIQFARDRKLCQHARWRR